MKRLEKLTNVLQQSTRCGGNKSVYYHLHSSQFSRSLTGGVSEINSEKLRVLPTSRPRKVNKVKLISNQEWFQILDLHVFNWSPFYSGLSLARMRLCSSGTPSLTTCAYYLLSAGENIWHIFEKYSPLSFWWNYTLDIMWHRMWNVWPKMWTSSCSKWSCATCLGPWFVL